MLTDIEEETITYICSTGLSYRHAANHFHLSVRSVESRMDNIRHKLNLDYRSQVVTWGIMNGYLDEDLYNRHILHQYDAA